MSVPNIAEHPCRILIVDDSELNRNLTSAVLASLGEVDCAESGAAALEALDRHAYDLVLLDLDMPVLDGHETASAIREKCGRGSEMKIVSLSSARRDTLDDRDRWDGHLSRPISSRDLLGGVRMALAARPSAPAVWDFADFQALAVRLGDAKMGEYLRLLRADCVRCHAAAAVPDACIDAPIQQMAHDLCSTAGMFGFRALLRSCLDLLATPFGTVSERFRADLAATIAEIDAHFEVAAKAA